MTGAPKSPPDHGDPRRYRRGCHCRRCTDAISRQAKARVHAQHNGTYQPPFTDSTPSRQRLELLLSTGLMLGEISRLSGVNHDTLRGILGRRKDRPHMQISRPNEQKILAVRVSLERLAPTAVIDATGTRRRLQALACLGWTSNELARRLERSAQTLSVLRSGEQRRVLASTALAVRELYGRLCGTVALPVVAYPDKAKAIRTRARRERWLPPDAWFDVAIDDPQAEPVALERPARRSSADLAEDAEFLMEQLGYDRAQAAEHLGVKRDALDQAITRAAKASASAAAA